MSKAVQEQVNKLFEAVKDLHSLEEIKPHCEAFNEFINLKTTYTKDSLGTVLSRVGFYKKFKSLPLEQGKNADLVEKFDKEGNPKGHELQHYCLRFCGLSKEDWKDRNTTTRVNDRLSGDGQEVNPETYLEVTGKLLESNNPHELAVGLIAATGRRPHEILARAKFTQIKGEEYHVMFEGQGKKRGEKPVFKIATLYPANYIINKLNQLRELTKDFIREIETEFKDDIATQNRKIEDRRGNSLRRVVQEYFGGKDTETPVLNFRDSEEQNDCKALRAAYLCLATDRDCKGSLGSKMLHAAKLAGHFTNETPTDKDLNHLVTTLGYADYFTKKPVTFPVIKTTKAMQTTIKCSPETRDAINKLCKEFGNISQAQTLEKLIELSQQKPGTENNERLAELETNYQELVKVSESDKQVIKDLQLLVKTQQGHLKNSQETTKQHLETINSQKTRIEELETMLKEQTTQTPPNSDIEALEARFEARFQQLEELIKNQISQQSAVSSQELPVTSHQSTVTSYQSAARDRNQEELELMGNAELWKSRKTGVTEEKIRRCFMALCDYNNEVSTGDGDRVAITNIVLRQLSGTNGQVVSAWMEQHKDEILQHNNKFGMGNQKDANNLYTVFNRGKDIDKYLEVVKKSLFRN
ncbi:protelomerase family protein [Richelia sinica]|uniref:protelomerase family protein n=1 Tax=Richelia sinica TaxID=1357545 RepID=UPI001688393E|nr:protelomerase family protein [Richelia sinica]MBD2667294.1 hypothetical protein [Richelia sinica FACHB-800]